MSQPTYKKIEIIGVSPKSYAEATQNAVARASNTLHGIEWFEVTEMRGQVKDGKVTQYQVALKLGLRLDE